MSSTAPVNAPPPAGPAAGDEPRQLATQHRVADTGRVAGEHVVAELLERHQLRPLVEPHDSARATSGSRPLSTRVLSHVDPQLALRRRSIDASLKNAHS